MTMGQGDSKNIAQEWEGVTVVTISAGNAAHLSAR